MIGGIMLVFMFGIHLLDPSDLEGRLYPGHRDTPENNCSGKDLDDHVLIFLGNHLATGVIKQFPATVLAEGGRPWLFLEKNEDGSVAISLDLRGQSGTPLAQMVHGTFTVNPHHQLKIHRSDRSHLTVLGHSGSMALEVAFLNAHALWIDLVSHGQSQMGKLIGQRASCVVLANGIETAFQLNQAIDLASFQ